MIVCSNCQKRGLSLVGVIFMIHDERVVCSECGTAFTIPKSRKSLVIGIEYVLLLGSIALSLSLKTLLPSGVLLLVLAITRSVLLPKMAVEHKLTLNRLKKYRRQR